MGLCIAVGILMQIIYQAGDRSGYSLSTGLLFGLGINWFLGVLVAVHADRLAKSVWAGRLARVWPLVLLVAIALRYDLRFPLQGVYLLCGVGFTLMLIRFFSTSRATDPTARPETSSRAIAMLGLSSYPTYLFHGPVIMLVGAAVLRWHLCDDWRVTWLLMVGTGILAGLALGVLVERPIMSWRSQWLKRGSVARVKG